MIISRAHSFIFFHNPKVGGTSVRATIERFNDIALLADLMGHERLETTRIYLRRTASEQQKIVDKVVVW